jgi:hypothetical protein
MWDWEKWNEENTAKIENLKKREEERKNDPAYDQKRLDNPSMAAIDDSLERERLIREILKKVYDKNPLSNEDVQIINMYVQYEGDEDYNKRVLNAPDVFNNGEKGIIYYIYDNHQSKSKEQEKLGPSK